MEPEFELRDPIHFLSVTCRTDLESTMMETTFSPGAGVIGGAMIGLASAGLLLANGRVAGISGILGRSVAATPGDLGWRLAFLVGLPFGSWIAAQWLPVELEFAISSNPLLIVVAGLLVGVGTQLGSGCTSGHGVCGMARGSQRSIFATLTFMATGGLTVFVVRHLMGGGS